MAFLLERYRNTPTPQAPNTPWDYLASALDDSSIGAIATADNSAFPQDDGQFRVLCEDELLLVKLDGTDGLVILERGIEGTAAAAHADGTPLYHTDTAASFLRNPRSMTTLGDLEYMGPDGAPVRLAAPVDGQYGLTFTGGTPAWSSIASGGTVTSVGLSVPGFLSVSGSPITTSGTLAVSLATQAANRVFAGPATGADAAPTFRSLVAADVPDLSAVYATVSAAAPGGSSGSLQYNNAGAFGGDADHLFWDAATFRLYVSDDPQLITDWAGYGQALFLSNASDFSSQYGPLFAFGRPANTEGNSLAGVTSFAEIKAADGKTANFDFVDAGYFGAVAFPASGKTINTAAGLDVYVDAGTDGTVVDAFGLRLISSGLFPGGAVTNYHAAKFGRPTTLGATVTNAFGVYIDDHSGIGGTLSDNLVSKGASSRNVFEGLVLGATFQPTSAYKSVDGTSGATATGFKNGLLTDDAALSGRFLSSVTAHNLLSATHGDTTTGTVSRGDLVTGQGATPTWTRLAIGTVGKILQSDGTDAAWATPTGTGAPVLATAPTLTGPVTITEAVGSSALTLTGATQTSSFPVLSATQTWNNAGTPFTAWKLNVTNTASASGSLLLDLQTGGTSFFGVKPTGATYAATSFDVTATAGGSTNVQLALGGGAVGVYMASNWALAWSSTASGSTNIFSGTKDLLLVRDAANTLALRNSTNAQTFNIYNTFTDASNYERLSIGAGVVTANVWAIYPNHLGTGTFRQFKIHYTNSASTNSAWTSGRTGVDPITIGATGSNGLISSASGGSIVLGGSSNATTATSGTFIGTSVHAQANPTSTSTAVLIPLQIFGTVNFSNGTPGAGSYEALKIAVTETALPTGTNYLIRASAGAAGTTDMFAVKNNGDITTVLRVANDFSVGAGPGDSNVRFGYGFSPNRVLLGSSTPIAWSSSFQSSLGTLNTNTDLFLLRSAAAVLQLGRDVNGAAIAQTFKAHDGITGTDIAGANLILAGGRGTGAGAPGNLIFQTATALSTGTTAQTLATRLTLSQATLTFADAVNMAFDTSTGTKIGTGTTQKIGFYNATPVTQRADMVALTDSTTGTPGTTLNDVGAVPAQATINNNFSSVLTQINKVRTALRDLGLMA